MSTNRSRAISATLVAILVTSLLWGALAFTSASAQDTPATPPTANSGMMAGGTHYALHGAAWMTDTVPFGAGPHQDGQGQFMGPRGAASGRHQAFAGTMHATAMAGAMSGQHMKSGTMAGAMAHSEGQAGAGHNMDGTPCANCH